jgi:hypothetical protein
MYPNFVHFTESQEERQKVLQGFTKLATAIHKIDPAKGDAKSLAAKNDAIFQIFRTLGILTKSLSQAEKILSTTDLPGITKALDNIYSTLDEEI